jgi:hypothetical protein
VSFADAWRETSETSFADITVRVLSRAQLIASKGQSRRQIDADDIKVLRRRQVHPFVSIPNIFSSHDQ